MQSVLVNDTENKAFAISVHSDTLRHYKADEEKYVRNILPFLVVIFRENRYIRIKGFFPLMPPQVHKKFRGPPFWL